VLAVLGLLIAALALVAAGCGGGDGGGVSALPSSSCTDLEFEGEGDADVLIASDLPMQGGDRVQSTQMTDAIRYILGQQDWKAGDNTVAYLACDDSTAQTGGWDSGKCSQNGTAYADNSSIVGLIGTFNSGCAQIIIPLANDASDGPIAMVSPANTKVCLTVKVPSCEATEPDKYYPTGTRNYARVVALDDAQASAIAQYLKDNGVTDTYILNDKQAYGLGLATNLENAFKFVGVEVKGNDGWDAKASSYEALFNKVKQSGASTVTLAGIVTQNGVKLLKDKLAVLGDNDAVPMFAPDGFTPFTETDKAGPDATKGMLVTVAGASAAAIEEQGGAGAEFLKGYREAYNVVRVEPYVAYAAQAAQILLDAIANSDGSREEIITNLLSTNVTDGILGSFMISPETGDVNQGAITFYQGPDWKDVEVITPSSELVAAAAGG
jgi:branched-chain amino acid transport system substrate-binding protein